MAETDLRFGAALAQHAREELLEDERLVLGKEELLHRRAQGLLQAFQSHHPPARFVHVHRQELQVADADELAALVGQRDELLPLGLGQLAGRHVGHQGHDVRRLPGAVAEQRDVLVDPHDRTRFVDVAVLDLEGRQFPGQQAADEAQVVLPVVGVDERRELQGGQLLLAVAEHLAVGRVALHEAARALGHGDARAGVLEDVAVPLFALAERGDGPLGLAARDQGVVHQVQGRAAGFLQRGVGREHLGVEFAAGVLRWPARPPRRGAARACR